MRPSILRAAFAGRTLPFLRPVRGCLLLCAAACVLLPSPASAAADASAGSGEAALGLAEKAREGLARTRSAEARFRQTSTFDFLDVPLTSSGRFCFSLENRKEPYVFWEYREPQRSGFALENDRAALWSGQDARAPSAAEKRMLDGMTAQILQWIAFDTESLRRQYEIRTGSSDLALLFVPRGESRLFSSIELVFVPDFSAIAELRFSGTDGGRTVIAFDIERRNERLSGDCRR
ncbi:MAG: outer membrane lipoprotein carrier protein LolA [Desulfovibrionaceae bacterium]|nr:outer membrane lipoprotein carrier protein LolA [Desulfovibrionaceae bacterium]